MNTLNLIRRQIQKASAVHNAQITHTTYRGVEYDTRCVESKEPHGTFCYRGKTYAKWILKTGFTACLFFFVNITLTSLS